jgi:hypothetical protein
VDVVVILRVRLLMYIWGVVGYWSGLVVNLVVARLTTRPTASGWGTRL